MCAGLILAQNHQASTSFWWWALTVRWIVMHMGDAFHSHMPNIRRSRRMHSGHVLSKCHFYYRPGWLRKTALTQPTASHFSSIFHYTLTSDGLMLERSEKPIYLHLFVCYGLFLFLIPRFPYWSLWVRWKSKKELCFISYCDLENILVNFNIHRSWHVL